MPNLLETDNLATIDEVKPNPSSGSRIEELAEFADTLYANPAFLAYPPWKQERVFLLAAGAVLTQQAIQTAE